ncbi:Ipa protein [Colletotrichum scovillei]|uniref:Ipa protein n=2 Tax=Colletotrichum scovillei TaxID=1209932 RepID=A0A9P7RE87_9PEZI|nr:Ipa protein [Colletotrichum scovillei]KAG7075277.1 Ipa protein [Colletotrichum scovillei]KAG7082493.1 Ipa protein [Colletotrichum scovillei]
MPPPSRRKGQMLIIRAQELEAEINELKKDLDLSEFAVPVSKLKEQGKTEGALKRLDEFLVAEAGAKMSDLYSVMLTECGSYFGEQHRDAKAKGKMEWTPLPIDTPKTREEVIELRRTSAKDNAKDPTEPTKL